MSAKTLLIDCDGVLYPGGELHTKDIIDSMKNIYRNVVRIKGGDQITVSEKTIREGHLGVFNYIKEMCNFSGYDFKTFCQQMADKTDYSRIKENLPLYELLKKQAARQPVIILSNNSRAHIEKVFDRLFHKSGDEAERDGIKICDITSTEHNGYFHPKQSENGFAYFLEKIKTAGEDCVLLDDTPTNLKSARRFGIDGVLITETNTLEKYLRTQETRPLQKGRAYE